MKTKENFESKTLTFDKSVKETAKPQSLRPMRSMVKVRSFKPKTAVASMIVPKQELESTQN
jgi:hypothetical protein